MFPASLSPRVWQSATDVRTTALSTRSFRTAGLSVTIFRTCLHFNFSLLPQFQILLPIPAAFVQTQPVGPDFRGSLLCASRFRAGFLQTWHSSRAGMDAGTRLCPAVFLSNRLQCRCQYVQGVSALAFQQSLDRRYRFAAEHVCAAALASCVPRSNPITSPWIQRIFGDQKPGFKSKPGLSVTARRNRKSRRPLQMRAGASSCPSWPTWGLCSSLLRRAAQPPLSSLSQDRPRVPPGSLVLRH